MAKKIGDATREAEEEVEATWDQYWELETTTRAAKYRHVTAVHRVERLRAAQASGETTVPEDGE